tara:strand:- start:3054 stop:3710 length:657 start_codon:yes stop_codon:yes gene_type:complete
MAYFLGRDVKAAVTTEKDAIHVNIASGKAAVASSGSGTAGKDQVPDRTLTGPLANAALTDVTGVDITLGTVDEDIAYMGQKTALKAEIKKETTIVITRKKQNALFSSIFAQGLRYGANNTTLGSNILSSNLQQPVSGDTLGYGYRVHVMLESGTSAGEVMTCAACVFSDYAETLNADGVTEETMTFTTHITPFISTTAGEGNTAATGASPWNAEPYLF